MTNEETKEEKVEPVPQVNPTLIETVDRLEAANKEMARLQAYQTELLSRQLISGTAQPGEVQKKETEEEKYIREAKIRYAGTGLDPTPSNKQGTTYG